MVSHRMEAVGLMEPADLEARSHAVNDRVIDVFICEDRDAVPVHLLSDIFNIPRGLPEDAAWTVSEVVVEEIDLDHSMAFSAFLFACPAASRPSLSTTRI